MKRLLVLLSVVTALAVSGVATTTASAVSYHGVEVTCIEPLGPNGNEAQYTVTYGTHSFTFTLKYPGAKCLVH